MVGHVCAIDRHPASIERARAHDSAVDYIVGDFLTYPLPAESFNLVASVAALHHMDATAGLTRMRQLLLPGGTLVVVGLARSRYPRDLPFEIAAVLGNAAHRMTKGYWEQTAPTVWPPPPIYPQMRRVADQVLPGVRFRRHLLWRYSLTWTPNRGSRPTLPMETHHTQEAHGFGSPLCQGSGWRVLLLRGLPDGCGRL